MSKKKKGSEESYYPEWVPEGGGDAFATSVLRGMKKTGNSPKKEAPVKKKLPDTGEFVEGILDNNKTLLAKAITLIESNSADHYEQGKEIIKRLKGNFGNSLRVGITGPPGAGKSTLIEELGLHLIKFGFKVAVLAVDPSSIITKGSILGDRTRMEKLSRENKCFIRPSPSGGTLGGVSRKSRETMLLCEAAGYDVILIETVGVGQSEITVRSMVDFFLLLLFPGGGDELQGIKRGVTEIADLVVINKADGDNKVIAEKARNDYSQAVKYLLPSTEGWEREVVTCSAVEKKGIDNIWDIISSFGNSVKKSGIFEKRRNEQSWLWTLSLIDDFLKGNFFNNSSVDQKLPDVKEKILKGEILPEEGAESLLKTFFSGAK
ncbi:MAG: methylmalonyl Co-A mutase-associated GTPase MeaB [Acidobacteriota bacterium]